MFARVASGILLALGIADLGVLNLTLAPRLSSASAAATAAERPCVARETPPACDAPVGAAATGAVIWAASRTEAPPPARASQAGRAMPDVAFAFDSTRLEHLPAIHDLRRLAQELRLHPGRRLLLRGHSDPLGLPEQNLDLSRRRAAAVKDYLVIRGAPADRIEIEGLGRSEPADPLQTPAAWARDRRVEILWR
jgi:outer membrane protein OmpA-like peptidoglycan-associated protein